MKRNVGYKIKAIVASLLMGGCLLQNGSCSLSIRETVIGGFESISRSLAETLLDEFFTRLEGNQFPEDNTST